MLGLKAKLIAAGLAGVTIVAILWLGYHHYTGLVNDLARLEAETARLETEKAVQDVTIAEQAQALVRWRNEAQAQEARLEEQRRVATTAQAEVRRLNDIFAEHDLTRLTLARPGLIELRINSGTADVGRMLACASAGDCYNE